MAITTKNKKLVLGAFILGTVLGAVANEQVSSQLIKFNAGEPIIADDVNFNFESLQKQIDEISNNLVIQNLYYCSSEDDSVYGYLYLLSNGVVDVNEIYSDYGETKTWYYKQAENRVILEGNVDVSLEFIKIESSEFTIQIIPDDNSLKTVNCSS